MKIYLLLFTMLLGVVLAVHLAMNGKVGAAINNPRVGHALFWCIGSLGAVAIGVTGWQQAALSPVKEVDPRLLAAEMYGACLVVEIASLLPQGGVAARESARNAGGGW